MSYDISNWFTNSSGASTHNLIVITLALSFIVSVVTNLLMDCS